MENDDSQRQPNSRIESTGGPIKPAYVKTEEISKIKVRINAFLDNHETKIDKIVDDISNLHSENSLNEFAKKVANDLECNEYLDLVRSELSDRCSKKLSKKSESVRT